MIDAMSTRRFLTPRNDLDLSPTQQTPALSFLSRRTKMMFFLALLMSSSPQAEGQDVLTTEDNGGIMYSTPSFSFSMGTPEQPNTGLLLYGPVVATEEPEVPRTSQLFSELRQAVEIQNPSLEYERNLQNFLDIIGKHSVEEIYALLLRLPDKYTEHPLIQELRGSEEWNTPGNTGPYLVEHVIDRGNSRGPFTQFPLPPDASSYVASMTIEPQLTSVFWIKMGASGVFINWKSGEAFIINWSNDPVTTGSTKIDIGEISPDAVISVVTQKYWENGATMQVQLDITDNGEHRSIAFGGAVPDGPDMDTYPSAQGEMFRAGKYGTRSEAEEHPDTPTTFTAQKVALHYTKGENVEGLIMPPNDAHNTNISQALPSGALELESETVDTPDEAGEGALMELKQAMRRFAPRERTVKRLEAAKAIKGMLSGQSSPEDLRYFDQDPSGALLSNNFPLSSKEIPEENLWVEATFTLDPGLFQHKSGSPHFWINFSPKSSGDASCKPPACGAGIVLGFFPDPDGEIRAVSFGENYGTPIK